MLINLLSNARDASPPGSAVRVRSEVSEHTVDLIVEDEGSGIPKNIQDRLFEPFFTTKDPGEGTGLGLAISSGIVADFGGRLTAHNRDSGGAVFDLELPLYEPARRGATPLAAE